MTAEVAIFNKSAIALAADSAVSIEGFESSKIYNNAEKLFALTKHHPVAIMIFERNELQGVPWEIIIKAFRKELGSKSYPTVKEYQTAFLDFSKRFYLNIPTSTRDEWLDISIQDIIEQTGDLVQERVESSFDKQMREIDIVDHEVDNLLALYESTPYFDGLCDNDIDEQSIDGYDLACEVLSECILVTELSNIEKKDWSITCDKFYSLCKQRLLKQDPLFEGITGLVFAGYGETEYFPVLIECAVYGVIGDKLKVNDISSAGVTDIVTSGIRAFAQKEEVSTFMEGISQSQRQNISANFSSLLTERNESIVEIIHELAPEDKKEEMVERYMKKLNGALEHSTEELLEYTRINHVEKVLRMVEHLPKNELAYMAESMVNLTAFKRKVSNESDSVGGPIDVAVISKGDGFVWIKRKHYFPSELNTHYGPKTEV
ncbi:hypothetical protein [Vibrio parahaemolyticus]|uniref:hypothetical protein n=1 Tax=Vibrio parahaemolyticus TaxID=670 RepID=UPI00084B0F7E|nr:hypothetical protein [Vibrio parahaemolyticus]ODY11638.1 hypothetical protein BBM17_18705 [Vibrio parahaemolyticus]